MPYLDKISYVIIPDDATRILKLKAGEIDAAEFMPYSRVAELKADPRLNMVLFPAAKVHYFTLNNRPTLKDGTKNPLSDVRVRQALNYATDKQAMIQVVTYGIGTPQQSFMPMSTPLSYGKGPPYPYDPARPRNCSPSPTGHMASRSPCTPSPATRTMSPRRQHCSRCGCRRGEAEGRADGIAPRGLPATTPPTSRC